MSVAALIRAMAAAGAPPEAIAIAVDAIEQAEAQVQIRKDAARDKKRAQRAAAKGQSLDSPETVPGHVGDNAGTVSDSLPPSLPLPLSPQTPQTPTPAHPPTRDTTRTRKGDRISDDFEPRITGKTAEMVERWPPGRLDRAVAQFRDHYAKTGGDRGLSLDWQASLRTWLRNEDDRIQSNPRSQRHGTDPGIGRTTAAALSVFGGVDDGTAPSFDGAARRLRLA